MGIGVKLLALYLQMKYEVSIETKNHSIVWNVVKHETLRTMLEIQLYHPRNKNAII
jgi:hypothetical protein